MQSLYHDDIVTLDKPQAEEKPFEFDDTLFERLAEMMYHDGEFSTDQLDTPQARAVMSETARVITEAIDAGLPHEVPETVRYALENNAFVFSGFKTFHSMREIGLSMVTDKGEIKPFKDFLNDVQTINKKYNHNYLYAEYNHAVGTSLMAARWQDIEKDGDRYDLQYRTANDGKVREEHALLHETTLPASDPFWDKYYPPNGWNCRCTVLQVRKGKYPTSDPELAMKRGDNCTASVKQQMFRYNPGKTMQLFPPKHPYFPKGCAGCDRKLTLAYDPSKEKCRACKILHDYYDGRTKKSERKRIEKNRKLYEKLSKDKRYKDVEFNPINGALKATHIGHNEGSDQGFKLEKKLINKLYSYGHSIILADEQKKGRDGNVLTSLDMVLDEVRMDIKSITKNKTHYGNAIKSKNTQIVKYNARTDVHEKTDTLCIYFDDPTMFAPEKIKKGYEYMKTMTSKDIQIKHIICVINSKKGLDIKTFDFE